MYFATLHSQSLSREFCKSSLNTVFSNTAESPCWVLSDRLLPESCTSTEYMSCFHMCLAEFQMLRAAAACSLIHGLRAKSRKLLISVIIDTCPHSHTHATISLSLTNTHTLFSFISRCSFEYVVQSSNFMNELKQ